MQLEKSEVYKKLVEEKGHFYVCGDCTMADNVYQSLKQIIQELGRKSDQEVESYMLAMRVRFYVFKVNHTYCCMYNYIFASH